MCKTLIIVPSVPIWLEDNLLVFDRKYYDGIKAYSNYWNGDIKCIMKTRNSPIPPFGIVKKEKKDLFFDIEVVENFLNISQYLNSKKEIVLAAGDSNDQLHISQVCKKKGIVCCFIIEYILNTRLQIELLTDRSVYTKVKNCLNCAFYEVKRKRAFRLANGLQSNGTPAYYKYKKNNNNLLYFDTRIKKNMLIPKALLEERLNYLKSANPIRLAFSGRLVRMKGADHLLLLAKELSSRGVKFIFSIYGAGEETEMMREFILVNGLTDTVQLKGAVDFEKQLIPQLQKEVDLFIILHRQSDPSCTYLETLSCGIPIVGYDNKAFSGILDCADIGWSCKLGKYKKIADVVERIDNNRELLIKKSYNSLEFSKENFFEKTYKKRIEHLKEL